jgi:hypothetical protein
MSKKKPRNGLRLIMGGTAGHFVLNQKSAKFEDRRTRRDRARGDKNRNATEREMDLW